MAEPLVNLAQELERIGTGAEARHQALRSFLGLVALTAFDQCARQPRLEVEIIRGAFDGQLVGANRFVIFLMLCVKLADLAVEHFGLTEEAEKLRVGARGDAGSLEALDEPGVLIEGGAIVTLALRGAGGEKT